MSNKKGYWITYKDHSNKIIKREWHNEEFKSENYNREDEIEFDFNEVNLELDFISQNEMKIKSPSDFILANVDVKNGDKIVILNEGEYTPLPTDPNKIVLNFWVKIPSGDKKKISPNGTSQKEMIAAWTDDSSKWIGKVCLVEIIRQKVFQAIKDVIYLHPEGGVPAIPVEEISENEAYPDEN